MGPTEQRGQRPAPDARERMPLALALCTAVLAVSTAAPVIRLAEPLSPELIAALRVSVTALGLGLLTARANARAVLMLRRSPRDAALTVLAGLCLAAHFAAWISSLTLTSVVRSVALVSTTPLFAGLLARFLGDRSSPRLYLGTLVAVAGTLVMVAGPDPVSGSGPGPGAWRGDLLALSGAVTAAIYLALGRHVHRRLGDELPVEGYFACVNLVAAVALWTFALVRGVDLQPAGAASSDYLAMLWLGLVPGLVGHGLFNWAVRRLPVHVVSLAALLEPAGSALFAWLLLAEVPGVREALGALLLICGVALGLPKRE